MYDEADVVIVEGKVSYFGIEFLVGLTLQFLEGCPF